MIRKAVSSILPRILIQMLILLVMAIFLHTVYSDSCTSIEVSVCGRKYSLSVVSNSTILSIGTIPNGIKIIANETPARILVLFSSELQLDNVKGDVLDYRLTRNGSEKVLEIIMSKTSGLAEVEITLKTICLNVPLKVISLGAVPATVIVIIIMVLKVLKRF